MGRYTVLARAQDRMNAVDAGNSRTASSRLALVARRRRIVKIVAARALEKVATYCGGVAELWRGARQDCARKERAAALHIWIISGIGVGHESTDPQTAICSLLDDSQRQTGDIDEPRRALDIVFHQIQKVGAAGYELGC